MSNKNRGKVGPSGALPDQPPVPGGTTAIRDGQYVRERQTPPETPTPMPGYHDRPSGSVGLREVEEAVIDKRVPVTYQGSTAYVRLADVYAALSGSSDPKAVGLDVERLLREVRDAVVRLPEPTLGLKGSVNRGEVVDVINEAMARAKPETPA